MPLDQAYLDSNRKLLDEFGSWLDAGELDVDATVADADVFTGWRRLYSTGALDAFDESDIVEFLLDWCPHKYVADPDHLCVSVGAFLGFLADTGRLAGGAVRAAQLGRLATHLVPVMRGTDDPASFRTAKAVFKHPMANPPGKPSYAELLAQGAMSEKELEAELEARFDEYYRLPQRKRDALTERFHAEEDALTARLLDEEEEPEPIELPFVYVPPPPAEVEAVAAAAPMLAKIDTFREYLGDSGRTLTDRGNIRRADGKALIELLNTSDDMDPVIGDRTFRTSTTERLPGLNSIVNIAKEAGAVRVHNRRLVPVKNWSRNTATDRATAVYEAIIELGALGSRGQTYELFDTVDEFLDSGTVHWLARILDPDGAGDVDELAELIEPVLRDEIEPYWPQWSDGIERIAQHGISEIFQTLEAAGVIEWGDRRQAHVDSDPFPTGGTIRLTALGQHVVPLHLEEAGYLLRRVDDLTDAPVSALIEALEWARDDQVRNVVNAWRPDEGAADRVRQIVDFLAAASISRSRLKAFAALEMFEPDVVGPAMRGLLDGPAAGHAAVYLLHRGLVDEAEVRGLINIGVFVDMLSANLDDPEELCEMFSDAPQSADQYTALEQMVRHPSPETQLVLDTLGRHHPDKKLAKAARKSAMRHRSWMANRP